MFTVRVGMKGDGMSWGPLLSPTYTHVCEHNIFLCKHVQAGYNYSTHLCVWWHVEVGKH